MLCLSWDARAASMGLESRPCWLGQAGTPAQHCISQGGSAFFSLVHKKTCLFLQSVYSERELCPNSHEGALWEQQPQFQSHFCLMLSVQLYTSDFTCYFQPVFFLEHWLYARPCAGCGRTKVSKSWFLPQRSWSSSWKDTQEQLTYLFFF